MSGDNNGSLINIESWFIPLDIFNLICLVVVILLALLFLFVIAIDQECHTLPTMLVANSCLAAFLCASDILWITAITLRNDLKQIKYPDVFCISRGYLTYSLCAALLYSFLIQALSRYVSVVYPRRLFWQSRRNQLLTVGFAWFYALIFPMEFVLTNEIIYNVNNQICQIPLRLSFAMIFAPLCVHIIPVLLIMLIYLRLIQYVTAINKRIIPANIIFRARRELQMVRRTVLIVMILIAIGFPYAIFIFLSFFTAPPIYHYRLAYLFINVSLFCVLIALFQFTTSLKTSIMKKLNRRPNLILPAMT